MKHFLDPGYWRAVARNPVAVIGLMVDLAPIFAVVFWGWGAAPLVLLYWLENLVIGVFTVPRITFSSIARRGPAGLFGVTFDVPFFIVHYGLFCLAHGAMLLAFLTNDNSWASGADIGAMVYKLVRGALGFGQHMDWILALIIAFHALVLLRDFIWLGGWKQTTPQEEMFAPYGRVVGLHIGVFVVGGALAALGDPMIGALALVVARALWGLRTNTQPPSSQRPEPVAAAS